MARTPATTLTVALPGWQDCRVPSPPEDSAHPEDRAAWRRWLEEHHGESRGVWLVTWRKASGRTPVSYDEAVEEALCFGWVDSVGRALDDDRTMLRFTPRKPRSAWSRPNKERVARLEAAGLMAPAGAAAIAVARANGAWTRLDDVEEGIVPPDLESAFADHPGSHEQFDAFPRSVRRGILEWIVQAKRPETRARRVLETASLAERGERANQWRGRP